MLGPTLTGAEFGPALRSMLNGGLPVFLPAINVFGRVEQLVVLRANLGPGEFHRVAFDETVEASTAATRSSGSSTTSAWGMDWGIGGQVHFLDKFAVRIEYEHFNVREADDVQVYSLGVSYRFL